MKLLKLILMIMLIPVVMILFSVLIFIHGVALMITRIIDAWARETESIKTNHNG